MPFQMPVGFGKHLLSDFIVGVAAMQGWQGAKDYLWYRFLNLLLSLVFAGFLCLLSSVTWRNGINVAEKERDEAVRSLSQVSEERAAHLTQIEELEGINRDQVESQERMQSQLNEQHNNHAALIITNDKNEQLIKDQAAENTALKEQLSEISYGWLDSKKEHTSAQKYQDWYFDVEIKWEHEKELRRVDNRKRSAVEYTNSKLISERKSMGRYVQKLEACIKRHVPRHQQPSFSRKLRNAIHDSDAEPFPSEDTEIEMGNHIQNQNATIGTKMAELREKDKTIEHLESLQKQLESEKDTRIRELKVENGKFTTEALKKDARIKELEEANSTFLREALEKDGKINSLTKREQDLSRQVTDSSSSRIQLEESHRQEVQGLKKSRETTEAKFEELRKVHADCDSTLQAKHRYAQECEAKMEEAYERSRRADRERTNAQNQVNALKAELDELRKVDGQRPQYDPDEMQVDKEQSSGPRTNEVDSAQYPEQMDTSDDPADAMDLTGADDKEVIGADDMEVTGADDMDFT